MKTVILSFIVICSLVNGSSFLHFYDNAPHEQNNKALSVQQALPATLPMGDCDQLILINETDDKARQYLETSRLLLVKRSGYSYHIEFIRNPAGISATMTSENGVKFNNEDQVIFMDEAKRRVVFPFVKNNKSSASGDKEIHTNSLKIDPEAINWVANNTVTTLYIKDNKKNKLRKFTIPEDRSKNLKVLASCFLQNLSGPH